MLIALKSLGGGRTAPSFGPDEALAAALGDKDDAAADARDAAEPPRWCTARYRTRNDVLNAAVQRTYGALACCATSSSSASRSSLARPLAEGERKRDAPASSTRLPASRAARARTQPRSTRRRSRATLRACRRALGAGRPPWRACRRGGAARRPRSRSRSWERVTRPRREGRAAGRRTARAGGRTARSRGRRGRWRGTLRGAHEQRVSSARVRRKRRGRRTHQGRTSGPPCSG